MRNLKLEFTFKIGKTFQTSLHSGSVLEVAVANPATGLSIS